MGYAFAESGLESVRIPSTLRVLCAYSFLRCGALKAAELSEGLLKIGVCAFAESGLERVAFPASLRVVGPSAFLECARLREVALNEGLEALGRRERSYGEEHEGAVFAGSALEAVALPSTLRVVERGTLERCRSLKRV